MSFWGKYIRHYGKLFCAAVACLTLEAACDLLQPAIMARIVDLGVSGRNMEYVVRMGLVMLGITALGAASAVSRNIISNHVSQRFGAELRSDLFRKIQHLSMENLNRFETASLVTRLTNDVTQVQNFVNGMMRIFVKAPLLCIGSIIMASVLNYRLALILIIVVPLVGILIIMSVRTGYPFFKKVQKTLDHVNSVIREYVSGVRVVKAFNRFDYEMDRFDKANRELSGVTTRAMRVMAVFTPSITLTVNIGIAVVLWLGGYQVNAGTGGVHVGQVMAFVNYMTQILFALMMISFVFTMFVRARASAERIGEVMKVENSTPFLEQPVQKPDKAEGVRFEHVSFSYTGSSGEPVLYDIDFRCAPGETLGIIGSTGAGKSSLVNLIPRFYDATSGYVRVGDVDVRGLNVYELRDKIAVVPQKSVLFSGTILENIRWGKAEASLQEVERAAKIACAHEFITSFPEGYNTCLGQGGVNLSGGQKQRISIARALVREPEILILDDCTSAVDMATEAEIRSALKKHAAGITCFLITQRITSVMGADRILVLEGGSMAGMGTHETLMETCPVYQEIYRSQIGKEGI